MSSYGQRRDAPGTHPQDPHQPEQPAGRMRDQHQPVGWSQPDPRQAHPPRSNPFQPESSHVAPDAERQGRGQAPSGHLTGDQQVWSTEQAAVHPVRQAPPEDPRQALPDNNRQAPPRQQARGPVHRAIPAVTLGEIPGRRIAAVVGDVIGVVTRNRVQPQRRTGQQQAVAIANYEAALTSSRQDAIQKMIAMAVDAGADAVVGMRFDSTEISEALSEVSAYGTGVVLVAEQNGDDHTMTTAAGSSDETPHAVNARGAGDPANVRGALDRTTYSHASQPENGEPAPGPVWRPRRGSGTLFGDQEMSDQHAASSPVLPGHPRRTS